MKPSNEQARLYREKLLADPYRPGYHFAIPDGNGVPGDSNGAFYADGRYHLMYLYRNDTTGGFHWGHQSSLDLLHWRNHPDALTVENGDNGCFSGGAFVDDDGMAYLTFWKFPSREHEADDGGIDIACAAPPYLHWERIRPIAIEGSPTVWGTMDIDHDGITDHISCADPSNIWKCNGYYYLQTGNKVVLDTWGREAGSDPRYKGDWTDLFRSRDLKNWEFVHRFYQNPHLGPDWPDETEDDMCPSFLPLPDRRIDGALTDRWLQLFIAHNKGGQYYIGRLEGETFCPEQHGRFSWQDPTCFAPEALIDGHNRQIAWFWLTDDPENAMERYGWTGVYSFPRVLWLEDGTLHMAPARELEQLQFHPQTFPLGRVAGEKPLPVVNGASFRLQAEIQPGDGNKMGVVLRRDEETGEETRIYADLSAHTLVMDATRSGCDGRRICERAPFALEAGETLRLDLFADQSVVEVYANERQAICRRIYPTNPEQAQAVCAFSDGAEFGTVRTWEMMPSNPY